jgi:hypothetical protein
MSQPILILKGTEAAAGENTAGASNVGSARVVRCVNTNATTDFLVTLEESGGTDIGTLTLAPMETVLIRKDATDKIFAENADVKLTAVGVWSG